MQTDADGLFWDDNVVDVYKWKAHDGTGSLGKYNLSVFGSSHTFQDSGNKYDTAWRNNGNKQNGAFYVPVVSTLRTLMAGKTAWTLEAWMYAPNKTTGEKYDTPFCQQINSVAFFGYSVSTTDANSLYTRYYSGTGGKQTWTYPTNDWHHFSMGWDGSKVRFWVDGTLKATVNSTTNFWGDTGDVLYIGGSDLVDYCAVLGWMDRVIISDVDRAGAETSPLTITGRAGIKYGCILGGSPKIISGGRL